MTTGVIAYQITDGPTRSDLLKLGELEFMISLPTVLSNGGWDLGVKLNVDEVCQDRKDAHIYTVNGTNNRGHKFTAGYNTVERKGRIIFR